MRILGKHEDQIYKTREFIRELGRVQDTYLENLFKTLEQEQFSKQFVSPEEANDWLFDYVFNCDEEITFEEYLANHGKKIDG